ncbi:alpha-L-arabinofuranosidase C-terminal domain-containing protein [Synoicihabitans lomoniglobus]|uniref:non-reducing end alpha-L-arabinofuranosidase n=1 Tax=Synoicihabitans lomoniglobus TaxID=2909285 RepID=A0AAE9ZW95_9BACT|nr:alpha-N-arabinofuranosidase [Opitutaceae bacterium LMO-M01]WED64045.1 alpha-L-arabinofuranosidase C-terminal domain-containing protein [Opitutaceae bacterium LMO-M01]
MFRFPLTACFLKTLVPWLALAVTATATPTLRVDLSAPGRAISSDLVGIFYEDLNYAADGGLYAELIQNRSFEYSATEQVSWTALSFWELIQAGDAEGSWGLGNARPVHVNNEHYLTLTARQPGDGVGIRNSGFDQIPVEAGHAYEASFFAYQTYNGIMWRGDGVDQSTPMPVTLRLEAANGEVLAEAKLEVSGRDWTRYHATLTPSRPDPQAKFVLLIHQVGSIALDMVSLMPHDTFKGRANGLRRDLAHAIADLEPKFMRFPGGCLVHGPGVRQFYDWKKTIGPVETREAERNSWGYHQTYGLGFFEFFQFSEDIGAKPVPVVSAGVCCQHAGHSPGRGQEGLPMEEMPAYIQDVLDLIEWANGPADSEWGAVRAAAGHPEPFGLQHLGVGNEDAITPLFEIRFNMVRDAIKARYPDIVVIGTSGPFASGEDFDNGWAFARDIDVEMVDEHYYVPPQFFWDNQDRYDHYDRAGPLVYLGEYAAHEPDRRNTLRSAIAEAAGLVSYERNADIVHFASYAPLLARRGHTQWHPDLIYFDATSVFLTPNYYVQQLFGQHGGDRHLDTALTGTVDGAKLAASSVTDSASGDVILKLVNGDDTPVALEVQLSGLSSDRKFTAQRMVLTGPSADAINEDGREPAVKPVSTSTTITATFHYQAPANSLTVLRFNPTTP